MVHGWPPIQMAGVQWKGTPRSGVQIRICEIPGARTSSSQNPEHADYFIRKSNPSMPTVTFRILYVFVVLALERRRVVACSVAGPPIQDMAFSGSALFRI